MIGRKGSHHLFLLGVIALVSIVAIYIIIKVFAGGGGGATENLRGRAAASTTIEFNGKSYPVVRVQTGENIPGFQIGIASLAEHEIELSASSPISIGLGESALLGNQVVTYLGMDGSQGLLIIAQRSESCTARDGQTPLCRGDTACLDGVCTQMPACTPGTDQVMWGERVFHCCDDRLSGVPCSSGGSS